MKYFNLNLWPVWLAGIWLGWPVASAPAAATDSLVSVEHVAAVVVDPADYPVVGLSAGLFAEDVLRVTGTRPAVTNRVTGDLPVVAGTLGHSALIDGLVAAGKLPDADKIRGRWEATLEQVVDQPWPGTERAIVIAGSDRRGTAYGLMRLSEQIGVSPWYWWADVPVRHRENLGLDLPRSQVDSPGVKYRGFFINDEDWGINPWAGKTYDPDFKNIGPKTYTKVFELMLRLRLNYLWPAMHGCTTEFAAVPENAELADRYAMVAGSSHCEPMLCNNVHWKKSVQGPWNYQLNRDKIRAYWQASAQTRGDKEAVWTLGIRGIHDQSMESPPTDLPGRIQLVTRVIHDQRELIDQYVTKQWGPVAQCFVPYKEVLPIYDGGLQVPDDVTLVWVDDNFGYLRRLSSPAERERSGGAGVYWHISYFGGPHSYTWINTTAPALMWEELHKAWENQTRTIWVINVGDIKPMELGIDYFSRLAWSPDGWARGGQHQFLEDFATRNFGPANAAPLARLLTDFYRLGTFRKPELMNRQWALGLSAEQAAQCQRDYESLLQQTTDLEANLPAADHDAAFETVIFPARVLAMAGLIFMADRQAQLGHDVIAEQQQVAQWRGQLAQQVTLFNTQIAGGKWNRMMPGLETGHKGTAWSSQVRWPWAETNQTTSAAVERAAEDCENRAAARTDQVVAAPAAAWSRIEGLGASGQAMACLPATPENHWPVGDPQAPAMEYDFHLAQAGDTSVKIDFLPTFRLYPGTRLRVAVAVDDAAPVAVEVPGSSGTENENGLVRNSGVQNNSVTAVVSLPQLAAGPHRLVIRAVDPGAVVDQLHLPR